MLTKAQGKQLINLSRLALNSSFGRLDNLSVDVGLKVKANKGKSFLEEKRGVFVTLKKNGELRGCIGFVTTGIPLGVSVLRCTRSAAFEDPRFPPVKSSEIDNIKIEVTVLTPLKKISIDSIEDLDKIKVGKDGLFIQKGVYSGLLLPQVAVEQNWDSQEFLENTCLKAGLHRDAWIGADLYKFQGQVFFEQ